MEGIVLDSTYESIDIIDTFESFIWVDRFLGYGDFEIVAPMTKAFLDQLSFTLDDYIQIRNNPSRMIIETIELRVDVEKGPLLTISGRSLESILERYIVWGTRILSGNFQDALYSLFNETFINPSNPDRKIPNFIFKKSNDPEITKLTCNIQLVGDNIYDVVYAMCLERGIGFRVLPYGAGGFEFELYRGVDRSYDQVILPGVVFSPTFENLIASNFIQSHRALKTAALIGGEGEGEDKIYAEIPGTQKGLHRREMYIQASGLSSNNEELTPAEYHAQLIAKGHEELSKTKVTSAFEGEIDARGQYVYGVDFFIGDIVQIVNEYKMEAKSRVTELIHTHDEEGEAFYPTFTSLEED